MAEQDPAVTPDTPEGQGVPDWVPEKFKNNPEAFADAYTAAERKITELSTQNKGLEESIGNLSAQFEQFTAAQTQPDPQAVYGQWSEMYEQDPVGTMAQIAQATAQQALQQYQQQAQQQPGIDPADYASRIATQALAAKYGDEWDAYKDKVGEEIKANPVYNNDSLWVNPDLATQALDGAFETVKAREVLSGNTVVQQQMADTRQMKLAAQSAVGASGRPDATSADVAEWAAIKNAAPKTYY